MSTFQDQVAEDLVNVFFNFNEMAEQHEIDGILDVLCIIDTNVEQPLTPAKERREGTYTNKILLFVMAAALNSTPDFDDMMDIDAKQYRIINVNSYQGMFELTLEAVT